MTEASSAPPRVGRAELATRRMFAVGAAVLALVVTALTLLLMLRDGDRTLPTWYGVIAGVTVAAFLVPGMAAPWLSARGLRIGAAVSAGAYLVMLCAFLPAAQSTAELERIPWMLTAAGAAVLAGLLAGGLRMAWAVLAAAFVGTLAARFEAGGFDEHGLVNDAQMVLTGVVICVICGHLLAIAQQLDDAAVAAADAARRASAERGRLAAGTRAAALVHDEVLATLNLAGSGLPLPADRLAEQARRAADQVVTLAEGDEPVPPLAAALERAAHAAGAEFVCATAGAPPLEPPVREALEAAAVQALENSVRHAGPAARRHVRFTADDREAVVEIDDDGAGFDPSSVPEDRLGVRTSIRARMNDVGGAAQIDARPGGGVRVRLRWRARDEDDLVPAAQSRGLSAGLVVIAVVFVAGQAASAAYAALVSPAWWVPLLVLAGILVTAEVLRLSPDAIPSTRRTAAFVALTVGTVAVALPAVPYTFGTLWFAAAAAFLLLALALRSRPGWALAGVAALVAVIVGGGIAAGAPAITIGQVAARPVVLVVLAVALLVIVARMQKRTRALYREAVASARRSAWDGAARAELSARVAELDRRVMPLLRRIGDGRPLDESARRECVALEGELRDEYRAGSLAREPLSGAVRAARERGVDVVLLDDADSRPAEHAIDAIAVRMAEQIAVARTSVVGRLLPAGRGAIAMVTVDGRTTDFGGSSTPIGGVDDLA